MSESVYGERIEALVEGLDAMLDHMNDSYREWMKTDDPIKKRMCSCLLYTSPSPRDS